jgi:hypothetical protein
MLEVCSFLYATKLKVVVEARSDCLVTESDGILAQWLGNGSLTASSKLQRTANAGSKLHEVQTGVSGVILGDRTPWVVKPS